MLKRVAISNYRGFQSYTMEGLTRVNLLVGKNNSGKSALLESIHFLGSGGDPSVLTGAANRRGEVVMGGRDDQAYIDVSHLFNGHQVDVGSKFSIEGDNGQPPVSVEAVALDDFEQSPELFDTSRSSHPAFALKMSGKKIRNKTVHTFFLSEEGALLIDPERSPRRYIRDERRDGPPIVFISPDSISEDSLGVMWNQVLRDKQEADVRKAMQILAPTLDDIVFQTGELLYRYYSGRLGVLVSFEGDRRRVPLGSMGDGMRRLLALSISLIHAKGGLLLVDEIDTGFHFSIMADLWRLVSETARQNDIQVFATTHSLDCVRGLGVLCKSKPEAQGDISVQKIIAGLPNSVAFNGSEVLDSFEQDIELR